MFLASVDPDRLRPQMQLITSYILATQNGPGDWDYVGEEKDGGDTSMVQYALLGLWAAKDAGIDVPNEAVDRAARWLLKTQKSEGGYGYHPFTKQGKPNVQEQAITSAGASGIGIVRIMMYPESNPFAAGNKKKKEPPKKKFGVLEEVQVGVTEEEAAAQASGNGSIPIAQLDASLQRSLGWMNRAYNIRTSPRYHFYYLYTLERCASLAGVEQLGTHNWYADGTKFLVESQLKEGNWAGQHSGPVGSTCFAVMFLMRATGKALGAPDVGGGLLAGGRGLPDDLTELAMKEGEVVKEKKLGPLDELLKELANTKDFNVSDVQQAIVEKVEIGSPEDREKLIQQKNLLLRLVKDRRPEVRRTAMWALGRTDDLQVAKPLIGVLNNDNNVDVLVEARSALCVLSRRPRGFGFPTGPYDQLSEQASDDEKVAALTQWRTSVFEAWRDWYLKVRPYDERDELAPFGS